MACRGAHLERATFSALALLANGRTSETLESRYARLGAIDGIPKAGAEALLDFWRARRDVVTAPKADAQREMDYVSA